MIFKELPFGALFRIKHRGGVFLKVDHTKRECPSLAKLVKDANIKRNDKSGIAVIIKSIDHPGGSFAGALSWIELEREVEPLSAEFFHLDDTYCCEVENLT